jgi:hypothetical protein
MSRALTYEMKVSKKSEAPNKETREEQSKIRQKDNPPSLIFTDCRSKYLLATIAELLTCTMMPD